MRRFQVVTLVVLLFGSCEQKVLTPQLDYAMTLMVDQADAMSVNSSYAVNVGFETDVIPRVEVVPLDDLVDYPVYTIYQLTKHDANVYLFKPFMAGQFIIKLTGSRDGKEKSIGKTISVNIPGIAGGGSTQAVSLEVPIFSQYHITNYLSTQTGSGLPRNLTCGPTSLYMIDSFYTGIKPTTDGMKKIIDYAFTQTPWELQLDENGADKYLGPRVIGFTFTRLASLVSTYWPGYDYKKISNSSLNAIKAYLDNGIPVATLMSWNNSFNHFVVVTGYDGTNININYPGRSVANESKGIRPLTEAVFDDWWKALGREAIVLTKKAMVSNVTMSPAETTSYAYYIDVKLESNDPSKKLKYYIERGDWGDGEYDYQGTIRIKENTRLTGRLYDGETLVATTSTTLYQFLAHKTSLTYIPGAAGSGVLSWIDIDPNTAAGKPFNVTYSIKSSADGLDFQEYGNTTGLSKNIIWPTSYSSGQQVYFKIDAQITSSGATSISDALTVTVNK